MPINQSRTIIEPRSSYKTGGYNTRRNAAMNNLTKQNQFSFSVLQKTFRGTLQFAQLGISFSHYNKKNIQAFRSPKTEHSSQHFLQNSVHSIHFSSLSPLHDTHSISFGANVLRVRRCVSYRRYTFFTVQSHTTKCWLTSPEPDYY